jgi:hypothetical protein
MRTGLHNAFSAERSRQFVLVSMQNIDAKPAGTEQRMMQTGGLIDADQECRRLHRQRAHGCRRHAEAAVVVSCRDDAYRTRQRPHGFAKITFQRISHGDLVLLQRRFVMRRRL